MFFVGDTGVSLTQLFHRFYLMAFILIAERNIVCIVATGVQYSKP